MTGRGDRGSSTVLAAAMSLVLVLAGSVAMVLVDLVLATHRARASADLVALAAATAVAGGREPCTAARAAASVNAVSLVSCRADGWSGSFVVIVSVRVDTGLTTPLPGSVTAESRAGNAT